MPAAPGHIIPNLLFVYPDQYPVSGIYPVSACHADIVLCTCVHSTYVYTCTCAGAVRIIFRIPRACAVPTPVLLRGTEQLLQTAATFPDPFCHLHDLLRCKPASAELVYSSVLSFEAL